MAALPSRHIYHRVLTPITPDQPHFDWKKSTIEIANGAGNRANPLLTYLRLCVRNHRR